MAIREELVASAVQFLRDPSVASSTTENHAAFLRSKNLTQEEINVALARAGSSSDVAPSTPAPPPAQYYQSYPPQYPSWQPPPLVPRRDWRDWFIMATVAGSLGYGCYNLVKRYVYPMIAPPAPERLEEDKKEIGEQFQKVFTLVEQLAQDTMELKETDRERTMRLDSALAELEQATKELKSTNREKDIDSRQIREDIQNLKASIPKAMEVQKDVTERRLVDVNKELTGLKTLVSGMNTPSAVGLGSSHLRSTAGSGNANMNPPSPKPMAEGTENSSAAPAAPATPATPVASSAVGSGKISPMATGNPTTKPSIPAWQLAMAQKSTPDASGSSQDQASSSS